MDQEEKCTFNSPRYVISKLEKNKLLNKEYNYVIK